MSIPLTLSQSVNDLGASFLFAKYFHNEPPFYSHYHAWVTQSYYDSHPRHVLRATIEAVGMAGLANVLHSPRVKSASEEQYRKASHSMREALNDPVETTADTTLLAVIFFEFLEVRKQFDLQSSLTACRQSSSNPGIATPTGKRKSKSPSLFSSCAAPSNSSASVAGSSISKLEPRS
jgi:hypothetical protein